MTNFNYEKFKRIEQLVRILFIEYKVMDPYGNPLIPIPIEHLIEISLGFTISFYEKLPAPPGKKEPHLADSIPSKNIIRIAGWVAEQNAALYNSILAHELAHLLLHGQGSRWQEQGTLPEMEKVAAISITSSNIEIEREAWYGAVAILLPRLQFCSAVEEAALLTHYNGTSESRATLVSWLSRKFIVTVDLINLALEIYNCD